LAYSPPGYLPTLYGAIMRMHPITYFKVCIQQVLSRYSFASKCQFFQGEISSGSKFHISLGHETVLAKVTLFGNSSTKDAFDPQEEYQYLEKVSDDEGSVTSRVFAILDFERPVTVVPDCKVLGSRLDADVKTPNCRLAFHGELSPEYNFKERDFLKGQLVSNLKVFKSRRKEGVVERANNEAEVICKGMFKKETDLSIFSGLDVSLSTGEIGIIGESFGQSGKFKVRVQGVLQPETMARLSAGKKKKGAVSETVSPQEPVTLTLHFKKHIFSKKMSQ